MPQAWPFPPKSSLARPRLRANVRVAQTLERRQAKADIRQIRTRPGSDTNERTPRTYTQTRKHPHLAVRCEIFHGSHNSVVVRLAKHSPVGVGGTPLLVRLLKLVYPAVLEREHRAAWGKPEQQQSRYCLVGSGEERGRRIRDTSTMARPRVYFVLCVTIKYSSLHYCRGARIVFALLP